MHFNYYDKLKFVIAFPVISGFVIVASVVLWTVLFGARNRERRAKKKKPKKANQATDVAAAARLAVSVRVALYVLIVRRNTVHCLQKAWMC